MPPDKQPPDSPIRYRVEFTEPALAEADAAYLWLSQQTDPEYAVRWYEGLFQAAQTLSVYPRVHAPLPGPHPYTVQVRRMLYSGPSRRRSGSVYRLLYFILEPEDGEEIGTVRILHLWHGASLNP